MPNFDRSLKEIKEYYGEFGTRRVDVVNSGLTYEGISKHAAATSDTSWQIKRISVQGNETVIEYADNGDFDQIWDDRNNGIMFNEIPFLNTRSIMFDGINDYIDFGNNFNFDRTNPFTISCWIYLNSTSGDHTIFSKRASTSASGMQFKVTGGRPELFLVNTQTTNQLRAQAPTANNLSATTWYNLVVTYDGSSSASTGVKFYRNGATGTTAAATDNLTASILNSTNAYFGQIGGVNYLNGALDEVSIWNEALTAAKVTEIYNNGVPTNLLNHSASANLLSWYRMGDGDTFPTILDNNGTVNGAMTNSTSLAIQDLVP